MAGNDENTSFASSTTRVDEENGNALVPSDERTPLLGADDSNKPNGAAPTDQGDGAPSQQHEEGDEGDEGDEEGERTIVAQEVSFVKLCVIMGASYFGVFLGAIDSTIIATLSGAISSEFKSLSLLSWLATAYLISTAACQPISGRLTDIFGRGPGLVLSNLFFAAGNLICGLAQDESVMILGRVVAGIGGGGMMSISTFIASDLIPLRQRGVVQGLGNICYGSGAMLGGIFGGLLNDHTKMGWRLAFLIQVPPVLVSAVLVAFLVRIPPKQSDKSYLARIDFFGVLCTLTFLVLLLLGLNSGGNIVPWINPLPLTTIPLSIVVFGVFLWWESRDNATRTPIIPVKLVLRRTILAACLCNFVCNMCVMAGIFYLPLYLQVLGDSASGAGLKILPSPIGVAIGSVGSGWIMKKTGRYVKLGVATMLTFNLGFILFNVQNEHTPLWFSSIAIFFVGTGFGAMLTTTLLACIAAVDHSQQAVVTSATCRFSASDPIPSSHVRYLTIFFPDLARSLGGTIGVTVGSAVYQNILKARLWDRFGDEPNAAEIIKRIRDDLSELNRLPEGWYDGVIKSFMEAFRGVWITLLGLAVIGLVCISLMKQYTLHSTLDRR